MPLGKEVTRYFLDSNTWKQSEREFFSGPVLYLNGTPLPCFVLFCVSEQLFL